MDEAALLLRIRVITVSTRAAVRTLRADDPQVPEVIERGRSLLEGLAPQVREHGSDEVKGAFARAQEELAGIRTEA